MDGAYIGEIRYFSGSFIPRGWYACDGELYPIEKNEALYSIIGPNHGGDSKTNFAVPKIDDLNGCRAIICRDGLYPPRP